MNASLAEIERVVAAAAPASPPQVIAGSEKYLPEPTQPVASAAADFIVEAANSSDEPLYVAVLGAPTNVASALLMDPSIGEKLIVIFVAGFPSASTHVDESFNLLQDLDASRLLFEKCPNLLYIPGYQVAEVLTVSLPETERYVAGRGPLGDFLAGRFADKVGSGAKESPGARRDVGHGTHRLAHRSQLGVDRGWPTGTDRHRPPLVADPRGDGRGVPDQRRLCLQRPLRPTRRQLREEPARSPPVLGLTRFDVRLAVMLAARQDNRSA